MPYNRSEKMNNRQNDSSINEKAAGIKLGKFAKRPPSLNGINKQLP
ncbi:hypothetical protein ACFSL6_11345 [Paenibacillus thailandensis]|uniref:Uncharacterized protein n=1 Tax=Paenibacillus thailandensis TaxID=393250 RepID=A0ABW5QU86_9BACL